MKKVSKQLQKLFIHSGATWTNDNDYKRGGSHVQCAHVTLHIYSGQKTTLQ